MTLLTRDCGPYRSQQTQRGMALLVGLIMLSVITLIGVTAMQSTILEEKMASNLQDRQIALQAAESAARYAWSVLDAGFDAVDFTNNTANNGYYDLRSANVVTTTGNKLMADWSAIASASAWPWADTAKRGAMADKVASDDPMKLATAPQFIVGMHAPILRKGTENHWCIPFSIIGAGQGRAATTRAFIALQVIPKSGCYRALVN